MAGFFLADLVHDLRDGGLGRVAAEEFNRVSGCDIPRLDDREVESRPAAREEPPDHVESSEPDPELVTRQARLRDGQDGGTDANAVSDADRLLREAFRREILSERPPGKIGPRELAPPERIVFARVRIDGLRRASVDRGVRLAVSRKPRPLDSDSAVDGLLENRRGHESTSPFDRLRKRDVHRHDAHRVTATDSLNASNLQIVSSGGFCRPAASTLSNVMVIADPCPGRQASL